MISLNESYCHCSELWNRLCPQYGVRELCIYHSVNGKSVHNAANIPILAPEGPDSQYNKLFILYPYDYPGNQAPSTQLKFGNAIGLYFGRIRKTKTCENHAPSYCNAIPGAISYQLCGRECTSAIPPISCSLIFTTVFLAINHIYSTFVSAIVSEGGAVAGESLHLMHSLADYVPRRPVVRPACPAGSQGVCRTGMITGP
jgi:hypothetical protein